MVPAFIAIAQILILLIFFRQEPIAFSISRGKEEEAKALLRKVYKKTDNFEALIDEQYKFLKSETSEEATAVSFKEAVCGERYRKATWIGVGLFTA